VKWYQILNWSITIILFGLWGWPYIKRIYASKGEKKQKKPG
jgi:hypothetical protein